MYIPQDNSSHSDFQPVSISLCSSPGSSCLGCLPLDMDHQHVHDKVCQQEYRTVEMLVIGDNGKDLVKDTFMMPDGCNCVSSWYMKTKKILIWKSSMSLKLQLSEWGDYYWFSNHLRMLLTAIYFTSWVIDWSFCSMTVIWEYLFIHNSSSAFGCQSQLWFCLISLSYIHIIEYQV